MTYDLLHPDFIVMFGFKTIIIGLQIIVYHVSLVTVDLFNVALLVYHIILNQYWHFPVQLYRYSALFRYTKPESNHIMKG